MSGGERRLALPRAEAAHQGHARAGRELQRCHPTAGEGDDANEAGEAMTGVNAFVIALPGVIATKAAGMDASAWATFVTGSSADNVVELRRTGA